MKRFIQLSALAIGCSIFLFACADGGNTNVSVNTNRLANSAGNAVNAAVNTAEKAANTVANTISKATTDSPSSFVEEASQGGYAEVEMGRLAVQKALDPEVKKFGQMMVDDHTKANTDLKTLAASKKLTIPSDLGSSQKTYDKLKGLSGSDFDKAYVDAMVEDHETDVAAFEKQADNGSDPEIKAFAAKILPVLKKHLEAIRAIKAKMK